MALLLQGRGYTLGGGGTVPRGRYTWVHLNQSSRPQKGHGNQSSRSCKKVMEIKAHAAAKRSWKSKVSRPRRPRLPPPPGPPPTPHPPPSRRPWPPPPSPPSPPAPPPPSPPFPPPPMAWGARGGAGGRRGRGVGGGALGVDLGQFWTWTSSFGLFGGVFAFLLVVCVIRSI